jgi:hypothetical protein
MSLTTLKRKTDGKYHVNGGQHGKGYVNKISSGRPAFSLNDSRRVEAQHGKESIQTKMRGQGFKGHGGHLGTFPIRPILSNYQNDYDPFGKPRRGQPVIVPSCPVVQQMNPLHYDVKYADKDAILIKKDMCDPVTKSGTCGLRMNFGRKGNSIQPKCESTFVKRAPMDYSQYIQKKKAPLTGRESHYPPMVSRNSTFVSVPNFSYADFISRVTCK